MGMDYVLELGSIGFYEMFIFFDHFLMASKVKFLARDIPYWLKVSCFGWAWSCIFKVLIALKKLQANAKDLSELVKTGKANKESVDKLLATRKELVLDAVMAGTDAVCAGSIIDYDKLLTGKKINNAQYGTCGMIAAGLAARKVWNKS